jgi:L-asparagine transporter-like permease
MEKRHKGLSAWQLTMMALGTVIGGSFFLGSSVAILATHIRFRKKHGCPPKGKCQMPGYPYTSWIALISMVVIILSMPFISGQASGLIAGIVMVALYSVIYIVLKLIVNSQKNDTADRRLHGKRYKESLLTEFSEELTEQPEREDKK